jgi:hypothetical protein
MEEQKKEIIQFVQDQKTRGNTITATLKDSKVKRSTSYSWTGAKKDTPVKRRAMDLTPEEKKIVEKTKEEYPTLGHRQIQGILQNKGIYLSFSSVYHHLKLLDMVEPFEKRPSPLKKPMYNAWCKNLVWGSD